MNARDHRQLLLMRALIEQFEVGEVDLAILVRDLEALSQVLVEPTEAFSEAFHEHWFDLEQVLAVALDRTYDEVLAENHELTDQAITNLKVLVADQLTRIIGEPDRES